MLGLPRTKEYPPFFSREFKRWMRWVAYGEGVDSFAMTEFVPDPRTIYRWSYRFNTWLYRGAEKR